MDAVRELLQSPLGAPLILLLGAAAVQGSGRFLARISWQSGIALGVWLMALWLHVLVRAAPIVPIFSSPWQPVLMGGTHLLWVGDGWNWYASALVLILGGVAILLCGFGGESVGLPPSGVDHRQTTRMLTAYLVMLSAALLFVGSGNLLTVTFAWVLMDVVLLARTTLAVNGFSAVGERASLRPTPLEQVQGMSLVGALLLMIGLLPAGSSGPGQMLQGGSLPAETVLLMLVASAIRAGAYPFHIWLVPASAPRLQLSDRFVDHLVPAVCGLWLLGWTSSLAGDSLLVLPIIVGVALLALLGSAVAAYTATHKPGHSTFVLVSAVALASLTSILSDVGGPAALIWPTTTLALGGGLWLVGERVWREWGWQIPVSVGALALVGVPFTPGFLTHISISRLLGGEFVGDLVAPFILLYLAAQTLYVSALLRSWGAQDRNAVGFALPVIIRLLAASLVLATPLAVAGLFPRVIAALASIPNAIPPTAGEPPTAVAGTWVWWTLGVPLVLGMGLALVRPTFWRMLGRWPDRLSRLAGLDWLSNLFDWSTARVSSLWVAGLDVVEGAGYVGWLVTLVILGYVLLA